MVALDLMLLSALPLDWSLGAVRLSLDEALDFTSMFRVPFAGACLVYL